MWYDDLGIISIGVQNGGLHDGGLGSIKVDLWKLFCGHCHDSYCPLIDHYALVVRIDGEFQKFGAEGIERVRLAKRERCVSAEIIIPEPAWRGRSENQLRDYLAKQVRSALQCCVARLKKERAPVDEDRFFQEVDAAIAEFGKLDYEAGASPPLL